MNCRDVQPLLNAYLDNEVSPSEKKLIQAHLGTCQECQRELESFNILQGRLRQHLKIHAAGVAPSPGAWSDLQAALPAKPPRRSPLGRLTLPLSLPKMPLLGELSLGKAALAFLIVLALIVSAPTVWAQMESWVDTWFSFSSPDGKDFAAIGGFTAFTPYHAAYLPKGFHHSGTGAITGWPDYEAVELTYDNQKNGQFFTFLESVGGEVDGLPAGDAVQVGGSPAVFIPGFAGSADELVAKKPVLSIVTNFDYDDTNLLAWYIGEVRIEMFSSLPKDEMLKIAGSLEHMQVSQGDSPPVP